MQSDRDSERMPPPESVTGTPAPAEPADIRRPLTPGGTGFLRVRMQLVDGSRLTVRAVRFVPDASIAEEPPRPGHVYEVVADGRTVTSGNLTDLGVRRSYGDPDAPPDRRGHLIIRDPDPEFTVRIPAGELSQAEAEQAEVRLYELADVPAAAHMRVRLAQFPAARLVATTGPGPLGRLPQEGRAQVARALRE